MLELLELVLELSVERCCLPFFFVLGWNLRVSNAGWNVVRLEATTLSPLTRRSKSALGPKKENA